MRNSNFAIRDALLKTKGGQTVAVQAKAAIRSERFMRYDYLKDLVRDAFPHRRDVQFHATHRPQNGQSRLWEIAGDEALTSVCADALKWAGTSPEAEIAAKMLINPPLK